MQLDDSILKHCLRNVRFITGTSYAGKSTMVRMLAERYDMVHCGENFHGPLAETVATPDRFPNLCYFGTMSGWQEFLNRTPEDYARWIDGASQEASEFEVAELLQLSRDRLVIADTNLSVALLHRIAEPHQVAIMLSPTSMAVESFFDRDDPDKQFLLDQIGRAEDPEATMANFRACMAKVNSPERYAAFAHSGFFTYVRQDTVTDTREEVLSLLARHFQLA